VRRDDDAGLSRVATDRLAAQLLTGTPARSVVAVADRLLAVQAQDARGARLAIRARSRGLHTSDVDRAFDDGSVVVTWLNRGTLHLVRTEDYWWLHALTTPPLFTANATRLRQEGVTPDAAERGVAVVERALADEGRLTRVELRERIAAGGVRTEGQALVHLLVLASLRGLVVRGPMKGGEQAYVLVRDWLGERPTVDRDTALAELARRYLRGHGPASDRDLARWAGLPLRDVRAGLSATASQLASRDDGLAALKRNTSRGGIAVPAPTLLGAFDPLLLGWLSREHVLAAAESRRLVTDNGIFRPFALVDGRACAVWRFDRGRVELTPFGVLAEADAAALAVDAEAVAAFLATAT
jgi:hypothetical protein